MRNEQELQSYIRDIKANDWIVPDGTDKYRLVLELMASIGSTDSELRDDLIYEFLCRLIPDKDISDEQIRDLTASLIGDDYLFHGIGSVNMNANDDSVFTRAFTVLVVVVVLERHNSSSAPVLDKAQVLAVWDALIRYMKLEKDVRGYVEVKGWAHTAAHTADALAEAARCVELGKSELSATLEVIREKICIDYHAYVNGEEERLTTAVISIYERKLLSTDDFIQWFHSFETIEFPKSFPQKHVLCGNHKNFLAAMFFRFNRRCVQQELLAAIIQAIDNTTPVFYR